MFGPKKKKAGIQHRSGGEEGEPGTIWWAGGGKKNWETKALAWRRRFALSEIVKRGGEKSLDRATKKSQWCWK